MRIVIIFLIFLNLGLSVFAETIVLQSGQKFEAKIRGFNVNELYIRQGQETKIIPTDNVVSIDSIPFLEWSEKQNSKTDVNFFIVAISVVLLLQFYFLFIVEAIPLPGHSGFNVSSISLSIRFTVFLIFFTAFIASFFIKDNMLSKAIIWGGQFLGVMILISSIKEI